MLTPLARRNPKDCAHAALAVALGLFGLLAVPGLARADEPGSQPPPPPAVDIRRDPAFGYVPPHLHHARQFGTLTPAALQKLVADQNAVFARLTAAAPTRPTGPMFRPLAANPARAPQVVYGYYPYWTTSTQTAGIRWDTLTHVAWFGVDLDANGDAADTHGWSSTKLVTTAHSYGIKVDLAFTNSFDEDIARAILQNPTTRARAIKTMIDLMELGDADGIAVDFEGVPKFIGADNPNGFVDFIAALRAELTRRGHPTANLSVAAPAVDWNGHFNLDALAPLVDQFFIMAYDYHYSGSPQAGPVGQIRARGAWAAESLNYERTLATYLGQASTGARGVVVLGVPYYGRRWTVTDPAAVPATVQKTASTSATVLVRDFIPATLTGALTRLWDTGALQPYARTTASGNAAQSWCDDHESLGYKYRLAYEQGLGGVGIWALGYDIGSDTRSDLASALGPWVTGSPAKQPGSIDAPIAIASVPFTDRQDTSQFNGGNWFNKYTGCNATQAQYGREFVYRFDTCESGTLKATVADGAGVDIDIHILSALDEDACLARNDKTASIAVSRPGSYYIVADTFVSGVLAQAGVFDLSVEFTSSSSLCAGDETCVAGRCVGPGGTDTDTGGSDTTTGEVTDTGDAAGTADTTGPSDGTDSGDDASAEGPDAGPDSGADTGGTAETGGALDGGPGAGPDAGPDGASDDTTGGAGVDSAATDAGLDNPGGPDAGPSDGPDSGLDGGNGAGGEARDDEGGAASDRDGAGAGAGDGDDDGGDPLVSAAGCNARPLTSAPLASAGFWLTLALIGLRRPRRPRRPTIPPGVSA
jgi:spore germination protein YaaH